MRRGVGVSHVQQQQQTQQRMTELGAQITAERVANIADQLDDLEGNLRQLMKKHEKEIRNDPIVRARFRQIADSIGVDLISSSQNIFSGALGLGNFYYDLARRLVEACMAEQKFCGSYVPLQKALHAVQRVYDRQANFSQTDAKSSNGNDRLTISEEDVVMALKKLHCLGAGYNIITLSGVKYVQTTPDGVCGDDIVSLLNFVLDQQKAQKMMSKKANSIGATSSPSLSKGTKGAEKGSNLDSRAPPLSGSSPLGAAYVLGTHPLSTNTDPTEQDEGIPRLRECVFLTLEQVSGGLQWPPHRAYAALERSVQDGSVWVDYPDEKDMANHGIHSMKASSQPTKKMKEKKNRFNFYTTKQCIGLYL
ncbi:unnamed protein product [Phytomonas sp. Hart1]|nr:unnamed protein product [Phytomonas sp. Hart1]|eukprot:CCW66590.1 unnamed protein product [Phytomonas sp. isolate Hart1]